MQTLKTDEMIFTNLRHMPNIKAYANKIRLADTVEKLVLLKQIFFNTQLCCL